MARNVKIIPEKDVDVEKIVAKLLKTSGLKIDEFLFKAGISMDAYRKMKDGRGFSKNAVENILAIIDVNKGFLTGDEELTSSGKLTGVQNGSDNKENVYKEMYQKFLGVNSQYLVIHRDVLKEHRLVATEQFEKDKKALDDHTKEIMDLHELIRDIATRPINIHLPNMEKTK